MSTLDLTTGARPDERFHVQAREPRARCLGWRPLIRITRWQPVTNPDDTTGYFINVTLFWFIQAYYGTAKCDATRTLMYRSGGLGSPYFANWYVMTTTPKELWAFRVRRQGSDPAPDWRSMGNA